MLIKKKFLIKSLILCLTGFLRSSSTSKNGAPYEGIRKGIKKEKEKKRLLKNFLSFTTASLGGGCLFFCQKRWRKKEETMDNYPYSANNNHKKDSKKKIFKKINSPLRNKSVFSSAERGEQPVGSSMNLKKIISTIYELPEEELKVEIKSYNVPTQKTFYLYNDLRKKNIQIHKKDFVFSLNFDGSYELCCNVSNHYAFFYKKANQYHLTLFLTESGGGFFVHKTKKINLGKGKHKLRLTGSLLDEHISQKDCAFISGLEEVMINLVEER